MAGIKSTILNHVVTTLESITEANNYNTTVIVVYKGTDLPTEKMDARERQAACAVNFMNEVKDKDNTYANDIQFHAIATFAIRASMDNTTVNAFLDFCEDIECALFKSQSRGEMWAKYYIVKESWISNIDYVETEEFNPERIQEAILTLNVSYSYSPLELVASTGVRS